MPCILSIALSPPSVTLSSHSEYLFDCIVRTIYRYIYSRNWIHILEEQIYFHALQTYTDFLVDYALNSMDDLWDFEGQIIVHMVFWCPNTHRNILGRSPFFDWKGFIEIEGIMTIIHYFIFSFICQPTAYILRNIIVHFLPHIVI